MPEVGREGALWKLAKEGAVHTPLDRTSSSSKGKPHSKIRVL